MTRQCYCIRSGEGRQSGIMSPQHTRADPARIPRLRKKAEAAQAAYELAKPSDKVAALFRFDDAVQELSDALMLRIKGNNVTPYRGMRGGGP